MFSPPSLLASDYYGPAIAAVLFCAFHVPGCRARPANFQCDSRGWKLWGLPESRFWPLGVGVSSPRDAGRLCRTAILHVHWNRVADACGKGPGAPSVGQSYLAIHADLSLGVLGLRRNHRDLVPCRCACASRTWN